MSRPQLPVAATALLACLCFLALAPPAHGATTRYAAYDGAGTACTEADPCAATSAVVLSADGDTVVLLYAAGHDYELNPSSLGLQIDHAITLRGEPGQPRPTIHAPASGFWPAAIQVLVPGVVVEGVRVVAEDRQALVVSSTGTSAGTAAPVDGSVVRDVVLEATQPGSSGAVHVNGASTLERATVRRRGSEAHDALWLTDGPLVRDSFVVRDTTASGVAIRTFGEDDREIRLRNLSVLGSGDGLFATGGPYRVSVRNSMVYGGLDDIAAAGTGLSVELTHSSFNPAQLDDNPPGAVVSLLPPNEDESSEAPQLVNPLFPAFDLHQLPGSPTVDAGSADAFTGTLDIDGEPRLMGRGIDIGADELPDTEPPETAIASGPAEGAVIPSATPSFEFSSPAADLAGFECSLDGAAYAPCPSPYVTPPLPDGAHSLRVRAIDVAGNADPTPAARGFTVDTGMASGSSSPPAGSASRASGPGDRRVSVSIKDKRLTVRGRRATVRISCPATETSPPCAGTLALKTATKRRLTLARARFQIASGKTKRVALRLSKRALTQLPPAPQTRVRAIVSVHDSAGNQARLTPTLLLSSRG